MSGTPTLPEILLERASREPETVFARVARGGEEAVVTYGDLATRAGSFCGALARAGVGEGDVVPLAVPTSADYLYAVAGAHLLGAAVAPLPPLTVIKPERIAFHALRLSRVAAICESRIAVVTAGAATHLQESAGELGVDLVTIESLAEASSPDMAAPVRFDPDRTALVQFSSGSTAEPKGVRIRYRNITANGMSIARRVGVTRSDSMLSFLPLFHDFGFFAGIVYPLLWDIPTWLFDTAEFVRRPSFWLRAMSRTRATQCPAPQFVYEVAVSRIRDRDIEGVDLSAWRVSYNGGEPIRAATVRAFNERFAPFGLSPTVVLPSYGMAESTLAMAIPASGEPLATELVSRDALVDRGEARLATDGEPALEIVSCGRPLDGIGLTILGDDGRELTDREVGEIALRGDSVADEYLVGPGETTPLVRDGWFRTGDAGYVADGRVYVTGRIKDLIIRGGRNYYPQDVERIVEALEGARLGGVVAFARSREPGDESVVVVVERGTADDETLRSLPDRARRAVVDALGLMVDDVVLKPRGWVPKTTSAKLQRSKARALYEAERSL